MKFISLMFGFLSLILNLTYACYKHMKRHIMSNNIYIETAYCIKQHNVLNNIYSLQQHILYKDNLGKQHIMIYDIIFVNYIFV